MRKAGNKCAERCRIMIYVSLLCMCISCNGQENPEYIGARYGVLDLDKVTFSEQLATMFSKTEKFYKLPKGDEHFDVKLNRDVATDTVYYIYRISPRFVAEGTFRFKMLDIKPQEVVDFYADDSGNFRKVEVSVYLSDKQYQELRAACKEFKDVTPENVRKVNNNTYTILQHANAGKQTQTTLYCLDNRKENGNDPGRHYFVRISKISLKVKTDKFYKRLNDEINK